MSDAQIIVNGQPRPLAGVPTHGNALDFLRGLGLTAALDGQLRVFAAERART